VSSPYNLQMKKLLKLFLNTAEDRRVES